jgi:plasmid stability protein
MATTLYVREVPDRLYGELRRRARQRGSSIAAEALRLLERGLEVDRPEVRDLLAEIRTARPVAKRGTPSAAELIREERERR